MEMMIKNMAKAEILDVFLPQFQIHSVLRHPSSPSQLTECVGVKQYPAKGAPKPIEHK